MEGHMMEHALSMILFLASPIVKICGALSHDLCNTADNQPGKRFVLPPFVAQADEEVVPETMLMMPSEERNEEPNNEENPGTMEPDTNAKMAEVAETMMDPTEDVIEVNESVKLAVDILLQSKQDMRSQSSI